MAVGKKYGLGLFSREIRAETNQMVLDKDGKQMYDEKGQPLSRNITVRQTQYHPWVLGGVGIAVVVGFLGCVITGNVTASQAAKEGFMSMFGF